MEVIRERERLRLLLLLILLRGYEARLEGGDLSLKNRIFPQTQQRREEARSRVIYIITTFVNIRSKQYAVVFQANNESTYFMPPLCYSSSLSRYRRSGRQSHTPVVVVPKKKKEARTRSKNTERRRSRVASIPHHYCYSYYR